MVLIFYKCSCQEQWVTLHDCECNDRCPACNKEIEPSNSYETKDIESYHNKIGDMQKLCERAYLEIDHNFEKLCDSDGYGPLSLVTDLEKAKNGKEYKDLSRMITMQHTVIKNLENEILHLKGKR